MEMGGKQEKHMTFGERALMQTLTDWSCKLMVIWWSTVIKEKLCGHQTLPVTLVPLLISKTMEISSYTIMHRRFGHLEQKFATLHRIRHLHLCPQGRVDGRIVHADQSIGQIGHADQSMGLAYEVGTEVCP